MLPYLRKFYEQGLDHGTEACKPAARPQGVEDDRRARPSARSRSAPRARTTKTSIVRVGRYGPYLKRGDSTAPIPDQTCPDELTIPIATEMLAAKDRANEPLGEDPETGLAVYVKNGRFGPYVQRGEAKSKSGEKPKMVSLLKGMSPSQVDLPLALRLLSLPRDLGVDADGNKIEAGVGRYGPFVKRGSDFRSLQDGDDVLTVGLERALELLAQEKRGRGSRKSATPIKVFEKVEGVESGEIKLLDGRYGPYVTDGDVNASLPRGYENPAGLTVTEALELLEVQRQKKGSRKPRRKAAKRSRKTTAKKSAKKATKKTTKKASK